MESVGEIISESFDSLFGANTVMYANWKPTERQNKLD